MQDLLTRTETQLVDSDRRNLILEEEAKRLRTQYRSQVGQPILPCPAHHPTGIQQGSNRDPTGIRAIGVIAADGGILTDSGADCSQENDREFVVRQLVAVKRDNVRLRDELQVRD